MQKSAYNVKLVLGAAGLPKYMEKNFFTTFEIARICGVFPSTVINWVKRGDLRSSRTAGGHRRVVRHDLLEFLKKFNYPVPAAVMGGKRKVLIVDDEAAACRLIARAFKGHSDLIETVTLESGIDALVEIGKVPFDLVILDVVMPVVDGASLCASLKANPATRGVKIIAVTGKRLPEEKLDFIKKNTDAFFRKPLSLAELRAAALSLLQIQPSLAHRG